MLRSLPRLVVPCLVATLLASLGEDVDATIAASGASAWSKAYVFGGETDVASRRTQFQLRRALRGRQMTIQGHLDSTGLWIRKNCWNDLGLVVTGQGGPVQVAITPRNRSARIYARPTLNPDNNTGMAAFTVRATPNPASCWSPTTGVANVVVPVLRVSTAPMIDSMNPEACERPWRQGELHVVGPFRGGSLADVDYEPDLVVVSRRESESSSTTG